MPILNGWPGFILQEDKGAFGGAELFGDAGKADAFGAQLDEFLNRFLSFHCNVAVSQAEKFCGSEVKRRGGDLKRKMSSAIVVAYSRQPDSIKLLCRWAEALVKYQRAI